LEATPLTSFVVMSLIGAGLPDHAVVTRGIEFLVRSARPEGSWPIDTNLSTWVTTLAVNALAIDPDFERILGRDERIRIRDWLLDQQYRTEHPYTLADAGGWAWTNLTGGVPDADDTPGALLALKNLGVDDSRTESAAEIGLNWLKGLQNRDGGIPTFCRGWGKLPFDRSSADLTAHTLRAAHAWRGSLDRFPGAIEFLRKEQRADGSWLPLWFGNQHAPDDENPTYGTARVVLANVPGDARWGISLRRGVEWLVASQNPDGGWGGGGSTPSTIEETALAVEALAGQDAIEVEVVERGVAWLAERTARGTRFDPSPIGFYFAKLWYFEKLYPLIFTVAALNAARARSASTRMVEAIHRT
jgi:squalene-hopene/tetraprenyl-beta-curcumene cyclase